MNIQAKAGLRILNEQRDKYRLSLLQRDDDSPVLVLNRVNVADGHEEFSPLAELDMSGVFEQVFKVVTGA